MPYGMQRDPLLDALSKQIDSVKEQIAQVQSEITELKESKAAQIRDISEMKSDRDEAKAEADRLYEYAHDCSGDRAYRDIAWGYREDAGRWMDQVREVKEDLGYAYDTLDGIKESLTELYEKKDSLEAELKSLKRQHKEQAQRIKARNAANWRKKPCAICKEMFDYNITWEHIPNICPECKKRKKSHLRDQ